MALLMLVDRSRGETPSQAVRRRFRQELAGRQISVSEVARRMGVPQQKLSRRMTGETPLDIDDIDAICRAAGLSYHYIVAGVPAVPDPELLLPRLDSNQQPVDCVVVIPPPARRPRRVVLWWSSDGFVEVR